jgi:hypothetical protein
MFTIKNIPIISICIIIIVIITFLSSNNNKINAQIQLNNPPNINNVNVTDSINLNDIIHDKRKCLYINSLAINSRYLIDYFRGENKDIWYVNSNIASYIISDDIIFSTIPKIGYINIKQNLNMIPMGVMPKALLQIQPNISDNSGLNNLKNTINESNNGDYENIIINRLSLQQKDTPVIYDTYKMLQNIKYQIYNIIKNGPNAKGFIYKKIFSNYVANNYKAFVIYVDYLHFGVNNNLDGVINIIQTIYNIIKNIEPRLPVNFIIELPRTLSIAEMNNKINMINNLTDRVNPNVSDSTLIKDLILGFNIVPGIIGDNNDISYYSTIWSNYMANANSPYRFYFDTGNYGRDKIINNDSLIQTIPINPSNITNIHNIISYPYIINIIRNNGGTIQDGDISLNMSKIDDSNVELNYGKISLNICPFTDYLFGYSPYYCKLVADNLDKLTVLSPLLPFFYKEKTDNDKFNEYTLNDEYANCINNNIFPSSSLSLAISKTYEYITGNIL